MSHYFETGVMGNGKPSWHSLESGVWAPGEITTRNLFELADPRLGSTLTKTPLHLPDGRAVDGHFIQVRDCDKAIIGGPVGRDHTVCQPQELLDLIEALVGYGAEIATAMLLKGGNIACFLLRLQEFNILGQPFRPYLSLADYRSGGSRKCYLTEICEVCWNTHSLSVGKAKQEKRIWSKRHFKKSLAITEENLAEAREILKLSELQGDNLRNLAEILVRKDAFKADWIRFAEHLFPDAPEGASKEVVEKIGEKRSTLFRAATAQDFAQFRNSAWGMLAAATNFASHVTDGVPTTKPERLRARQEDRFLASIEGSALEEKALEFVLAL